jgi:hypothetical protein
METEAAAPAVKVSSYERGAGIKVGEYERAPPGKREAPADPPAAVKESEKRAKQGMTVEEYLQMDLREQQAKLVDMTVGGDPVKAALVERDAEMNKPPPEPPGVNRFIADLKQVAKAAGKSGDKTVNSIVINALNKMYSEDNKGGQGLFTLHSHLKLAGLDALAEEVIMQKYSF